MLVWRTDKERSDLLAEQFEEVCARFVNIATICAQLFHLYALQLIFAAGVDKLVHRIMLKIAPASAKLFTESWFESRLLCCFFHCTG